MGTEKNLVLLRRGSAPDTSFQLRNGSQSKQNQQTILQQLQQRQAKNVSAEQPRADIDSLNLSAKQQHVDIYSRIGFKSAIENIKGRAKKMQFAAIHENPVEDPRLDEIEEIIRRKNMLSLQPSIKLPKTTAAEEADSKDTKKLTLTQQVKIQWMQFQNMVEENEMVVQLMIVMPVVLMALYIVFIEEGPLWQGSLRQN